MSDPRQNKKVHSYKSETFQTSQTSQTSPTNLRFVRDARLQIWDLSVINVRICQSAHNYIFVNFNKSKKRSFVTTSYITNSTHTINTTNTIKESVTSVNVNKDRSAVIENIKTYNKNYPLHTVKGDSRSSYKSTAGYFFPHAEIKKIKGVLGKIYISTTKNNTIITLIDNKGSTKGWSCSGSLGFKNARKSTTYAAQAATENIVKKAKILGYTHLRILVKGLGRGKQSCLRALSKSGLKVISIEDKTGIPYNGCRLSKSRRV
ncbi:MAG: 30S ribosomal protein S11 [Cyanobacteriota bacterium]|nr:MAG: 30S ribosomal protein S11 [Cyanobacteriota bacterium]